MEISTVTPLMNFESAIIALLALIFLNETIKITQWTGIGLLLIGGHVIETRDLTKYKIFYNKIKTSKGLNYLFLAILLY